MRYQRRLARTISRILILAQMLTLPGNAGFTPETLVYTPEACKPIADLTPEEYVISYSDTDQLTLQRVTHVASYHVHGLIEITCSDATIYTDAYQLLFLPKHNAWQKAGHLSVGDALCQSDGMYTYIEDIQHKTGTYTVYSISVSETHNLYATHQAILVHNSPEGGVVSGTIAAAGSLTTAGAESAAFVANPLAAAGALFLTFVGYLVYSRAQERDRYERNEYERPYYLQPQKEASTAEQQEENTPSRIIESTSSVITTNDSYQKKIIDDTSCENTYHERHTDALSDNSTYNDDAASCEKVHLIYADDGKLYIERKKKNNDAGKTTFQSIKMAASGGAGDPNDPRNRNKKGGKERKFNNVSRKEVFRDTKVILDNYEYWKNGIYKIKENGTPIVKHANYLTWDEAHNEIEVFKDMKTHIGALDPITLKLYKPPRPGRILKE